MSYALTSDGRDLASVLRLLADWGARHGDGDRSSHELCGTALETRWWCPTCSVAIEDPDVHETRTVERRVAAGRRSDGGSPSAHGYTQAWTTSAGSRACPSSTARRSRPGIDLPAAEPPGPAAALGPRGRPTPLQQHYVLLTSGPDRRRHRDHGARARRPARKPAGQAVRPRRAAAARAHNRRRGPPDLALGLGVDAGRSGKGLFRLAWVAVSLVGLAALIARRDARPARRERCRRRDR